jgi:antitoxin HicB
MREYTIVLTPEPDGSAWNVTVPALPGCFTYGETVDEAIENAQGAIVGHIAALQLVGQPVPGETEHPRLASIAVA